MIKINCTYDHIDRDIWINKVSDSVKEGKISAASVIAWMTDEQMRYFVADVYATPPKGTFNGPHRDMLSWMAVDMLLDLTPDKIAGCLGDGQLRDLVNWIENDVKLLYVSVSGLQTTTYTPFEITKVKAR